MYELTGVTLLVVEPEERVRSELVLDLFHHGACVLVAEGVEEALELMRGVRVHCAIAAPGLASSLRRAAADEPGLSGVPVVTREGTATTVGQPEAVEA